MATPKNAAKPDDTQSAGAVLDTTQPATLPATLDAGTGDTATATAIENPAQVGEAAGTAVQNDAPPPEPPAPPEVAAKPQGQSQAQLDAIARARSRGLDPTAYGGKADA